MAAEEYFFEGEKPPATDMEYRDRAGDLILTIAGAGLLAKTSIDGAANVDVPCTNNDDGTFTIDWPDATSVFIIAAGKTVSSMKIRVQVTQSLKIWSLPKFSIPIYKV